MHLYEQSTQFKYWRFSKKQLRDIRNEVNELAVKNAKKATPENDVEFTADDQLKICQYYESKIFDYCKYFKFPYRVQATAIVYFKRFYIYNSVIDHSPKEIMLTCLFLASKTENHNISVDRYSRDLPSIESKTILDQEFVLVNALKFHLAIHHPYLALHGIYLDCQKFIEDLEQLQIVYENAIELVHKSYHTDACFIFQQSQIALACFTIAYERENLDFKEKYIYPKYHHLESFDTLYSTMMSVYELLKGHLFPGQKTIKELHENLKAIRQWSE